MIQWVRISCIRCILSFLLENKNTVSVQNIVHSSEYYLMNKVYKQHSAQSVYMKSV